MEYYEFEVSLAGIEPRIWRRFLLPSASATFGHLHDAIQIACAWEDYHLFVFTTSQQRGEPIAGIPSDMDVDIYGQRLPDAIEVKLKSYFKPPKQVKCLYEYDFGDGWLHEVSLIRTVNLSDRFKRKLIAGERAFPPEDCGGLGGYERFCELLKTGTDVWGEDPDELLEWLGDWTPEGFDLEEVRGRFDLPGAKRKTKRKKTPRKA